jgi:hypothetical protein
MTSNSLRCGQRSATVSTTGQYFSNWVPWVSRRGVRGSERRKCVIVGGPKFVCTSVNEGSVLITVFLSDIL